MQELLQRIQHLQNPDNDAVATKQYVDVEIRIKHVFGLDVDRLTITASTTADNNDVKGILQALVNATTVPGPNTSIHTRVQLQQLELIQQTLMRN